MGATPRGETNQRWLGLVAGLAVFGGLLISVGAGCGLNTEGDRGEIQQMTPAQIRAEITAAVEVNQREQDKKNPTVSTINGFAHFKIAYPKSWMAEYKPDGFILSDTETNTSLTFYKQIIKNNPAPESVTPLSATGNPARFFPITTNSTTPPTFLYEVIMPNDSILEIASPASNEIINQIISSIIFL